MKESALKIYKAIKAENFPTKMAHYYSNKFATFHKVLIFRNLSDSNLKFIRQMNENEQDKCIFEDHFRFITSLSVAMNAMKINLS